MSGSDALYIRLVAAPSGEAPLWVREAWIGTVLPLIPGHFRGPIEEMPDMFGRGPMKLWRQMRYLVRNGGRLFIGYRTESRVALDILSRSDAAATDWWRKHAPHFFDPGRNFLFDSHVALLLDHRQQPIPPLPFKQY